MSGECLGRANRNNSLTNEVKLFLKSDCSSNLLPKSVFTVTLTRHHASKNIFCVQAKMAL